MNKCLYSRQHSWYQFNDEVVTKIKVLGDKKLRITSLEAKRSRTK